MRIRDTDDPGLARHDGIVITECFVQYSNVVKVVKSCFAQSYLPWGTLSPCVAVRSGIAKQERDLQIKIRNRVMIS